HGAGGSHRRALALFRRHRAGRPALLRLRHRPRPLRRPDVDRACEVTIGHGLMTWILTPDDLPDLARGAALLGTGGGGDPHIGRLMVEAAMRKYGPVAVLDPEELADDA